MFLKDTLISILKQSYVKWECIIVDDGSDDLTEKISLNQIELDHRFSFYFRPDYKAKGANSCRNFGFEQSKGEFILFMDSDDILGPYCLESRIEVFKSKHEFDLVVGDSGLIVNGKLKKKSINQDPKTPTAERYLIMFLSHNLPWTSTLSVLWKRNLISKNIFDESLLRFQDIDFHITALADNINVGRSFEIDNYYRFYKDKLKDENHIYLVLTNLKLFFEKHINFINKEVKYKIAFRSFISYHLIQYIYPNYHSFKDETKALIKLISNSGLYNFKQCHLLQIKMFFIKTGLDKYKYIGMHKYSTFMKRELEQ